MAWALLFLALAGCLSTGDEAEFGITGSFTSDRDNADIDTLSDWVRARGGEVAIMESFPEQFHASGLTKADCEDLAVQLDAWDFIQSRSDCKAAV